MSESEPRPGTTAALDHRVERLEETVATLVTAVELIKQEGRHQATLMEAGFKAVHAGIANATSKIDLLSLQTQRVILEHQNPEETPAGRVILRIVNDMRADIEQKADAASVDILRADLTTQKAATAAIDRRLAFWAGAIAIVVVIVNIGAPLLLRLLVP